MNQINKIPCKQLMMLAQTDQTIKIECTED